MKVKQLVKILTEFDEDFKVIIDDEFLKVIDHHKKRIFIIGFRTDEDDEILEQTGTKFTTEYHYYKLL